MQYLFLVNGLIFTVLHLYASYKKNKPFRAVTKGFIVYSLMSWYCLSVASPKWVILLALFFSFLGDMFLIPKGVKWFTIGGLAFWASHFFFIFAYSDYIIWENVSWYIWLIIGVIYVTFVTFVFTKLKKRLPKPLFYPMYFYLLTNGTMNCFALVRAFSNFSWVSALVAVGAILFFASDTLLFFIRFDKDADNKSHFGVMTCYLIAEILITLGFIVEVL